MTFNSSEAITPVVLSSRNFALRFAEDGSVESLTQPSESDMEYLIDRRAHPEFAVPNARWFGHLVTRARVGEGNWVLVSTALLPKPRIAQSGDTVTVTYRTVGKALPQMTIEERYHLDGTTLAWTVGITNEENALVTIGDLGIPLLCNTYYVQDPHVTYWKRLVRQGNIAGDNSFILWNRANGFGPRLVRLPQAGSGFEYYDNVAEESRAPADKVFGERSGWQELYTAYVHASVQAKEIEDRSRWRQPLTNQTLTSHGSVLHGFTFRWADDDRALRRILVESNKIDTKASPGLVVPAATDATLSLAARSPITDLTSEFPKTTTIIRSQSPNGRALFTLRFAKLGENAVTIHWGKGLSSRIEYFVTQPTETPVKKRAAFIVSKQQVRDPRKWYDGLFGEWDMAEAKLRTPDYLGGLDTYMVGGSDDPSLSKTPLVASKNLIYPEAKEIAAVEYYIKHFVWGKLQRTADERPFPYGIYGTPNWHYLRAQTGGWETGGVGQDHLWRTFDYPHLIQLYFQMYRVARRYPSLVHELSAEEYLDRADHTAIAFFEVPYQIKMGEQWSFHGWTDWAFKQGNFHELYIPMLIGALAQEGRADDAGKLRGYWEQKVKYFAYDHPYPFGSEMYFDTTAFQSTYAIGLYGSTHDITPDQNGFYDKNRKRSYSHPVVRRSDYADFIERASAANLAARGRFAQANYLYGSDIRQQGDTGYLLSYMTPLGGAPLLDEALRQPRTDFDLLRLGYASLTASWALVNAGDAASNYVFWYPGQPNDGAAGWAFNSVKFGAVWAGPLLSQGWGAWRYDGEIDNGFSDALLSTAAIVTDDPDFGLVGLGCDARQDHGKLSVSVHDGVRQKILVRAGPLRIDALLDQGASRRKHRCSWQRIA